MTKRSSAPTLLVALMALVLTTAACIPAAPPSPAPYLDPVYSNLRSTPEATPRSYGAAPPIDPTVGPNDPYERQLNGAGNEILHIWATDPVDNKAEKRPAIIFIHGGGFKVGIGSGYPLLASAKDYAERGYVLFSIEYRTDTTSDCQAVQDYTGDPNDPAYLALRAQCERGITAAQQDAQAAVRWVRRRSAGYRVDPNMIAVGGFSAGAVTAANLAYNSDQAGTYAYSTEDNPRASSKIQAAFGSSGCNYDPSTIGAGDAPVSFIHGELDPLVDYDTCVVPSFRTARGAGLVAELTSYCGDRRHAQKLYLAHQVATDKQWTTFLARELEIYSGMRPPSAAAFCP